MQPTIGRIVHYKLSDGDVTAIQQADATNKPTSRNPVQAGDVYPAMVVRVFDGAACANLQVFLDGDRQYWATSRGEGEEPGRWSWPAKV